MRERRGSGAGAAMIKDHRFKGAFYLQVIIMKCKSTIYTCYVVYFFSGE